VCGSPWLLHWTSQSEATPAGRAGTRFGLYLKPDIPFLIFSHKRVQTCNIEAFFAVHCRNEFQDSRARLPVAYGQKGRLVFLICLPGM
jgi:hypothetical protein